MPDVAKKSVVQTFEPITTIFSQENDIVLLVSKYGRVSSAR